MTTSILIVDDEPTQRLMLSKVLEKHGNYGTHQASNGKEALFFLTKKALPIHVVILDVSMPEMDGLEALELIKQASPDLPVIMLSGNDDKAQIIQAMKLGALDFLHKPADPEQLLVTVRNALTMSRLTREVSRLQRQEEDSLRFEDIVGHDDGLSYSISLARKASQADVPVMIDGETGVGKELIARAIHGESARAGKPFIAVNCGAIPEKLVESTLFGHEKGAYTGATERRIGKFREAEGGTIFLDEIGELPAEAQVKLLRVLQQKEVEPVGAGRPVPVNVRILSATNRIMTEEVNAGLFREDLYFRLHVFPITLPPLRERSQDIPALANHLLERFTLHQQLPSKPLSAEAMRRLQHYAWPGNVRELEHLLHRAYLMSDQDMIDELMISSILDSSTSPQPRQTSSANASTAGFLAMHKADGSLKTLDEIEQEAMHYALAQHHQNIPKAAQALGMAKSTFYRKFTFNAQEND